MMKFLKYTFLTLLTLVVVLVGVLLIGSKMSYDSDLLHTHASSELPAFTVNTTDGLANIKLGNMTYRARVAGFDGNATKPLVILLHGFPVTSAMWIELLDPLAQAGYRVVAFDQRGYSPSARPEEISDYTVDKLVGDVLALADTLDADRFHLVGHDWGAGVGWAAVLAHPERIISWTGLSIAHPESFGEALANDPDQQSKSAYFAFFQMPWVPETVFSFNGFSALKAGIYNTMSEVQRTEYLKVFSEPGALTAALNWYRAMNSGPGALQYASLQVDTPTLFIWGNKDEAVGRVAIDAMAQYMDGPYTNIELDAGHWLMEDQPERIVAEILQHLSTVEETGVVEAGVVDR
ncbi:MAG: pimeloyl-ACP methyl ester carboxylesterase [Limisphaerales bacterium]|jgi:pimeloyl-ACP methyl ester carboxylesterase